MSYKDTMKLISVEDKWMEVSCTLFDYKTDMGILHLGIHDTMQVNEKNPYSISEVSTGCKFCGVQKPNVKLATKAIEDFINKHTLEKVFEGIRERTKE